MPIFRSLSILMVVAILLNAMAPTLVLAAIYLQGAEINANTLVRNAYVRVTYYDSKGKQKLEKGWIDAIDETTFEIRSRALFGKTTIAYDKVLSVIMSEESATRGKQINEVDRFMRETIMAGVVLEAGEIDSSKVEVGAYAEVIYGMGEKLSTASGYIHAVDAESLTIGQGFGKRIAFERIRQLILAESSFGMDRFKKTTDILLVKIENKSRRIVGKVVGGVLGGPFFTILGGVIGANINENVCENSSDICIDDEVALGAVVGYLAGVSWGVSWADPHDRFIGTLGGTLIGGATGIALTKTKEELWPSFLIGPIIGATIMSELTRRPPGASRFSVGLAPNSDGKLSAIATLRF